MPKVSASVLIIRLDAIGDALALTPLLAALRRRALPVDLVLRRANAARLCLAGGENDRSCGLRAALERSRESSRHRTPRPRVARMRRIRTSWSRPRIPGATASRARSARRFGLVLRTSGASRSRRFGRASFSPAAIYRSAGLDPRAPHECEVLFRLAAPLIGNEQPTRDSAELRPLVLEREPLPDNRIAIQITDKWERLGLSLEDVVDLVRRVAAGGTPHLLAARREATYAERLASCTGVAVTYFDELEPWKAAIGAAPAIVAPDSGALQVAGMVGTPVVGIFPPGRHYALQVARWAPWAAPHRIVRADKGWPARANDALAHLLSS